MCRRFKLQKSLIPNEIQNYKTHNIWFALVPGPVSARMQNQEDWTRRFQRPVKGTLIFTWVDTVIAERFILPQQRFPESPNNNKRLHQQNCRWRRSFYCTEMGAYCSSAAKRRPQCIRARQRISITRSLCSRPRRTASRSCRSKAETK